jgi:hypothetical protein
MSLFRCVAPLLLAGNALAAGDGYIIGAGVEGDTADGLAGSVLGSFGFSDKTWLSAGLAKSTVDLPQRQSLETLYADLEIDHWFKPVGVRIGVAYWGDPDVLDSTDWRGSLYWRGESASISGNYEFRDFELDVPRTALFPGRTVLFDADGLGITARFDLSNTVDLSLSGMTYDYSVNFRPVEDRDIVSLLSVSRLSPINSLIDHRAKASLGIDHGLQRWQFDLSTSEGAVDGSRTKSVTVSFLTPMASNSDIEFSVGYDDSELYGDVTFFSVFFYFYRGGHAT